MVKFRLLKKEKCLTSEKNAGEVANQEPFVMVFRLVQSMYTSIESGFVPMLLGMGLSSRRNDLLHRK